MNLSLSKTNKKLICVTIGDIEGIGIHILLKEFKKGNINNFILITNISIFKKYIKFPNSKINLINDESLKNFDKNKLNIFSYKTNNQYSNTIDSLEIAYKFTKDKKFIGILTLPLNKYKIKNKINKDFVDQTSFFSNKEKKRNHNMIFFYKNKFFIPLTIHIELKKVHKFFKSKKNIVNKIENLYYTLIKDFKISKPRMILAGINPHAGENQTISKDDNKYLIPIIKELKKKKILINGPVSGDGMINYQNLQNYDAFIFTYHDQALIPFKIISNYEGVNFTSNLNIIRVSPSHGTAENLIGSKKIISKGVNNCFDLINKVNKNRT